MGRERRMSGGTREPVTALRAIIVGGGLIGNVHRRAALLNGAEIVGVVEQDRGPCRSLGPERWGVANYYDSVRGRSRRRTGRHPHLHAERHPRPVRPIGSRGRRSRDLREAPLPGRRGGGRARPPAPRSGTSWRPSRTPIATTRWCARSGSGASTANSARSISSTAPTCRTGCFRPSASSWRVDPALGGASRAFADIGSHWCDLVEWVSGERIAEVVADTGIAVAERPGRRADLLPRRRRRSGDDRGADRGHRQRPVPDRRPGCRELHRVPGVGGSQEPALVRTRLRVGVSRLRPGEPRERLAGRRTRIPDPHPRPALGLGGRRAASPSPRPATPRGGKPASRTSSPTSYAAIRGEQPEGLPTFADGARSLRLVEAVLESARSRQWTAVAG